MTAGRLAAVSPAATTNTVLYSSHIGITTSGVLHVANRSASGITYRVGHKDYSQVLTLDANTYDFKKGNPITKYKLALNPGLTQSTATPGLGIISDQGNWNARIGDVVRTTTTTTYFTKVKRVGQVFIDSTTLSGTFQGGETVTAGTSGLTGVYRGSGTSTMDLEVDDIASGDTTIKFTTADNMAVNDYIVFDADNAAAEVATITGIAFYNSPTNTGGATLTVTRGTFGTTAVAHTPGQYLQAYTPSGTTTTINEGAVFQSTDLTVTVTNGTTVVSGQYILVGNEVMLCSAVAGNDLTVERGKWGTTAANHNDGSTVTPLVATAGATGAAKWFASAEVLTGGTNNATMNVSDPLTVTSNVGFQSRFIWSTTAGQELLPDTQFTVDKYRTYRWDISDASNSSLAFRFSDVNEGTNATPTPGTEFTTGVTKVGTAGSGGTAYIEIAVTANTPDPLYYYADGTAGYAGSIDVVQDPIFTEIYVYDVTDGTPVTGNTFVVGTATQTLGSPTPGAWGYVQKWNKGVSAELTITWGGNTTAWASSDTFVDTPPIQGIGSRQVATVSSVTDADALVNEDYLYYDKTCAANDTNEHKGIVIGPGSHIVVYASDTNATFQLNGFENQVGDYSQAQYQPPAGSTP